MNWKLIINDILDNGYSQTSLAEKAGTTQVTIHHLKSGIIREPKYNLGNKLRLIHKSILKKAA